MRKAEGWAFRTRSVIIPVTMRCSISQSLCVFISKVKISAVIPHSVVMVGNQWIQVKYQKVKKLLPIDLIPVFFNSFVFFDISVSGHILFCLKLFQNKFTRIISN